MSQFFPKLNKRPEIKLAVLLAGIRDAETYGNFCAEIVRLPVEDERDRDLLAALKEKMKAIEALRNCIAHNRRPSQRVLESYRNARPLLDDLLDEYLDRWLWREEDVSGTE